MCLAMKYAATLRISNDRFRGVTQDNRFYPLASDAVLCWAGVHAGEEIEIVASIRKPHTLLQLSALTEKGAHATVAVIGLQKR